MLAPPPELPEHARVFRDCRPRLFAIAYRMLGTVAAAEDVVQDAYLRWQRVDAADVRSPRDYLGAMVTRLALDQLRSARARREVYVGPWLPEPLVGVAAEDPGAATALAESLSTAFLLMLERLTPTQRAAFLLHEVFAFDHAEIARILETSEPNARQLVARARAHLAAGRPRFAAEPARADDLARGFLTACTTGDVGSLVALLEHDVVAWADGGGKFSAARRPITGAERVARYVSSVVAKWRAAGEVELAAVSGGVGLVFRRRARIRAVLTVAVGEGSDRIAGVFVVLNPDKLSSGRPAAGEGGSA
jgi:RNA polymerase sigma-70 factor (ECF subfamily)